MNIKFSYFYRDSANYKTFHEIIFSNRENIPLKIVSKALRESFIDGEWFYLEEVELPVLFRETYDPYSDPSWHEFDCVEETDEPVDDEKGRDISFLLEIKGYSGVRL